ncbi:MAG: hypothetical protein HRT89_21170, partial [Lentisphaeria bacterium]|nr:hypothetical protein [Lentisphaeria bacterium]
HLFDVGIDQAPIRLVPKKDGRDMTNCVPLVCSAGTLLLKTNYTWHSASDYLRKDGERLNFGFNYQRADHVWEGIRCYTNCATTAPVFQKFVGSLTAKERELIRFPPVGNPYYTDQTLALLEAQYPGWNSEEYRAAFT